MIPRLAAKPASIVVDASMAGVHEVTERPYLVPPLGSKADEAPTYEATSGVGSMGFVDARLGLDVRTAARMAHLRMMRREAQHQLAKGAPIDALQRGVSLAIEEVLVDIVLADLEQFGPAPCAFSLLVLGSLAAMETGTHSDVDAALVLAPGNDEHVPWFAAAVDRWAASFTELGEPHGVAFCDNASPIGLLREGLFGDVDQLAAQWTDSAQGAAYRRALREARFVVGDPAVAAALTCMIEISAPREMRLAEAAADLEEAAANLRRFARAEPFDEIVPLRAIRKGICTLTRALATRAGIQATNTFDRIEALRQGTDVEAGLLDEMSALVEDISRFRMLSHLRSNCAIDDQLTLSVFEDVLPKSYEPKPDVSALTAQWTSLLERLSSHRW